MADFDYGALADAMDACDSYAHAADIAREQTDAGGRDELRDLAERLAILIDESGPLNTTA